MKLKSKKSALLMSFTSLLICFAMLVGSTFAWFTDTATTGVNRIVSGKLKVDIVDGTTERHLEKLSFQNKESSDNILWEPGVTFLTQGFKIKNDGNLVLKWKMTVDKGVKGETDQFDLKDVINFSIVTIDNTADTPVETEVDLAAFEGKLPSGMSEVYYLKGHMQEEAGNDYQNLSLNDITVTVYATQLNHEKDSYGPGYDENAEYPIASLADINAAIDSGKSTIVLDVDFTVDVGRNGGWTAFYFSKVKHTNMASQITLKGSGKVTSNSFVIWARDDADITIESGTYETVYNKADKDSHLVYANAGGNVTIKGGTFISGEGINYMFNVQNKDPGTIIIQGGLYDRDPSTQWAENDSEYIKIADGYKVVEETIDGATWYKVVAA